MDKVTVLFFYGAVALGWFCTLSGVALGGWLVFRTKKEHYDGLFTKEKDGSAEVFNMDDFAEDVPEKILNSVLHPKAPDESTPTSEASERLGEQMFNSERVSSIAEAAVAAQKNREANKDDFNEE